MNPGATAKLLWAAPNSLIGVLLVVLLLPFGGRVHVANRTLQATWRDNDSRCGPLARRLPYRAITLGHVIVAVTRHDLRSTLAHELVHVMQYERWGPLFLPAYTGASLWQWVRGRRPYWDNCFEVQARRLTGDEAIRHE